MNKGHLKTLMWTSELEASGYKPKDEGPAWTKKIREEVQIRLAFLWELIGGKIELDFSGPE